MSNRIKRRWFKQFVKVHAYHMTDQEIVDYLRQEKWAGINLARVRKCRQRLGIKKKAGRGVNEVVVEEEEEKSGEIKFVSR